VTGGHRLEAVARVGLTLVTGIAAFAVSFSHVRDVAEGNGQGGWVSWAIACSVDALAVVGGLEIRRSRRAGQRSWPGWGLVLLGVGMTVAANLNTADPGAWGAVMAVWPAVAFLALAGVVERQEPSPPQGEPADRAGTPDADRAGTPRAGTPRAGVRPDAELIAALAGVPRDPDGKVPVRRAVAALSCGPSRARRLLAAEGLLRDAGSGGVPPDGLVSVTPWPRDPALAGAAVSPGGGGGGR
jgi:Protein of unknown function (DUF2637)